MRWTGRAAVARSARAPLLLMLILVGCRSSHTTESLTPKTPAAGPEVILWAWESPQDLRSLDPAKAGVAFLAREVFLGADGGVSIRPRRQSLLLPAGLRPEAVVRVIARPGFVAGAHAAADAARAIAAVASEPGASAMQVDFDATASQRDFYRQLLHELRADLPPAMPLTITALVSWCGEHSWLRGLPVDAAVPMYFRMGGPKVSRAVAPKDAAAVREPLCKGSVGVSTDETWPDLKALPAQGAKWVYIFHAGSWTRAEIGSVNQHGFEVLNEVR